MKELGDRGSQMLFLFKKRKKKELENRKKAAQKSNATAEKTSEINTESTELLKLVIKCRNKNQPELFLPFLLGSQGCESTFRQIRSLSSTFLTSVNCSLYDMLQRLRRMLFLNDMTVNCDTLKFPRIEKAESNNVPVVLPTDKEIIDTIENARQEAVSDVKALGIDTEMVSFHCQVKPISRLDDDNDESLDDECNVEDIVEDIDEDLAYIEDEDGDDDEEPGQLETDKRVLQSISGALNMRIYSNVKLDEKSRITEVIDRTGKIQPVRKSSIVWLLNQDKYSLSSDRLQRVRESDLVEQRKG